ncbi:MAG: exodeoxyribonuclease VII small subunit, partial [Corynebacterium sp.]|nr:exodeoxyribonuclease VII small subunit [Corynebacterium sp.]
MSDTENTQTFRPLDELSYEQARDELVEVVKILELGQMSLDESLKYWERGEELAAY